MEECSVLTRGLCLCPVRAACLNIPPSLSNVLPRTEDGRKVLVWGHLHGVAPHIQLMLAVADRTFEHPWLGSPGLWFLVQSPGMQSPGETLAGLALLWGQ